MSCKKLKNKNWDKIRNLIDLNVIYLNFIDLNLDFNFIDLCKKNIFNFFLI